MGKVSFTVTARTAKLIGQENFATAQGAIVELVKNSYDADARNCLIVFENHNEYTGSPTLYIIDNGTGMTRSTIEEKWMKIGTDDKLLNYETDSGRIKTGAKGIGRFALDRLGLYSEMFTVFKSGEGSTWSVQWSDFDKPGIPIHEVQANLDNANINLLSKLKEEFQGFSKIDEMLTSIDFQSGTILRITPLKDRWDSEALKSLFNNLEVLIPPLEQPQFKIHFFSTNEPDEFGYVNSAYYDDYDYKVSAKYFANPSGDIDIEITRNELNVEVLESSFSEVFQNEQMKIFPFDLPTFKIKTFELKKTIKELVGNSVDDLLIDQIGSFEFTFYFLKNTLDANDTKRFPYLITSIANRKAWLKKFGGVKIFRDDFRVRPYGEDGQDWLDLGVRQAKSPGGPGQKLGGYRIGPNQIAGTVKISRVHNPNFQDKSGREGIQENEAFEVFKNLLVEIIAQFERDRNVIMFNLAELAKQKFKDEEEKRKAQEEADRILTEQEEQGKKNNNDQSSDTGGASETEKLLARATKIYQQEIKEKNEEIRTLRGLASVGLIISSFAHEVKSLRTRLTPRTDFLIKELKKYISKKDLKGVDQEDDPFYMIQLIRDEDTKLKHWLDYSLSSLKKDKRTRTNINIGEYFERFKATWKIALVQRKVKLKTNGTKDKSNTIQAFEVDLDAIFSNLLSNSLNAFKEKSGKYEREIEINWKRSKDFIEIIFSDNGHGLAQEYKENPDRIFEYLETSRTDRRGNKIGTGMGLYIVKLVVNDYNNARVQILPTKEGFSMEFKLPVRKS
jgi:signal transduction histidine kinase